MANWKSCGNCIQCEKYMSNGKEMWACENYDKGIGMPFNVTPPDDEACSNWTSNMEEKDAPQDALRYVVDHFWDEDD